MYEDLSLKQIEILEFICYNMFKFDALDIKQLFEPYPETIFHDDPAKWAELIAVKWDIIEEKELEFV